MKLCFVGNASSSHARARAQAFASRGHEVLFLSRDCYVGPGLEGVDLWNPKRRERATRAGRFLEVVCFVLEYFRAVHAAEADVFVTVYSAGLGAWLLYGSGKCPHLAVVIGSDALHEAAGHSPAENALTDELLRHADMLTAESPHLQKRLIEIGVRQERIKTLAWGIDARQLKSGDGNSVRESLGIAPDLPLIFAPRGFGSVYDPELTLRSFAKLVELLPEAWMIMLGDRDGDIFKSCIQPLAHELVIADRVIFPGRVAMGDMANWYQAADVVLSTARSDGTPHSMLEAWAAGKPVVMGNLRNYDGIFVDGKNALLAEFTPSSFAASLQRILTDVVLSAQLATAGRKVTLEHMDFNSNVACVEGDLANLVSTAVALNRRPKIRLLPLLRVLLVALGLYR